MYLRIQTTHTCTTTRHTQYIPSAYHHYNHRLTTIVYSGCSTAQWAGVAIGQKQLHLARACGLVLPRLITLHVPTEALVPHHAAPVVEAAITLMGHVPTVVLLSRYLARCSFHTYRVRLWCRRGVRWQALYNTYTTAHTPYPPPLMCCLTAPTQQGEVPCAIQATTVWMLRVLCNALLSGMHHAGISCFLDASSCGATPTDSSRQQAWMQRRVSQLLKLVRNSSVWLGMMTCAGMLVGCCLMLGDVYGCTQSCSQWWLQQPHSAPCTTGHTPAAQHLHAYAALEKGMIRLQRIPLHDHIDALCRLMAALGLVAVEAGVSARSHHDMPVPDGIVPQIMVAAAVEVG